MQSHYFDVSLKISNLILREAPVMSRRLVQGVTCPHPRQPGLAPANPYDPIKEIKQVQKMDGWMNGWMDVEGRLRKYIFVITCIAPLNRECNTHTQT